MCGNAWSFTPCRDKKRKEDAADKSKTEDLSKLPLTDEQKALQEKAKEFLKKKGGMPLPTVPGVVSPRVICG